MHRRSVNGKAGSKQPRLEVHIKYENPLPEIPFPPKFLPHPMDIEEFAEYDAVNDLTNQCRQRFLIGRDVGAPVNLLKEEDYLVPDVPADLDPDDASLLEDDDLDAKAKGVGMGATAFLRKPEYLSADTRALGTAVLAEVEEEEVDLLETADERYRAVEATFEKAKTIPAHPTKPHLKPKEVLEILPLVSHWEHSFAQGVFDTDPTPHAISDHTDISSRIQHSLLLHATKGGDAPGQRQEKVLEYFVPSKATYDRQQQLLRGGEFPEANEEFSYEKVREYAFNIRQQDKAYLGGQEDMYAFVEYEEDGQKKLEFVPLHERVQLSKRPRKRKPSVANELTVVHRGFEPEEFERHRDRIHQIGFTYGDEDADAHATRTAEEQQEHDAGQDEQQHQEGEEGQLGADEAGSDATATATAEAEAEADEAVVAMDEREDAADATATPQEQHDDEEEAASTAANDDAA